MQDRPYYEAYDERYKAIHQKGLHWFSENSSPIVAETMDRYRIGKQAAMLEIGCGEGRDALPLLKEGYRLLATDISAEAIRYCRELLPAYRESFRVLDCISGSLPQRFDFIYAVAVVHMLVPDADRNAFYRFICRHLSPGGMALICSMGDGQTERQSDIHAAFTPQERSCSGKTFTVAATSCRMVSEKTFEKELTENGLDILEKGKTSIPEEFPEMIYAVVKKGRRGEEEDGV